MGNTATPTPLGGGVSVANGLAKGKLMFVPFTFLMSASYIAGGDTWTPPTSDVRGQEFRGLMVHGASDTTRDYKWNGSIATPKIFAVVTSTSAEVANAVDLSAVTVYGLAIYES